jgi:tRNA(Arg) A34 adenosine deaminase TadA
MSASKSKHKYGQLLMTDNRPVPPGLSPFWSGTVQQFAELQTNVFSPEEQERHRIYSLLLLSMIYDKWNGNKYGEVGNYVEWRENQEIGTTPGGQRIYGGGSYLGHNIAALAVDAEGRIIDFDFNHNQVFDSTVEHAESRLVRRVFALNQVYDPWFALDSDQSTPTAPEGARRARRGYARRNLFATAISKPPVPPNTAVDPKTEITATSPVPYASLLKDVTIYTSLESCAQCSGIMCLGSVKDIVYLQWDQGQFLVGNMMASHDGRADGVHGTATGTWR